MRFYRLSYQDDRYGARTAEEILCDRCVDAIRRDHFTWGITTEQIPKADSPDTCPSCLVAYPKAAVPA